MNSIEIQINNLSNETNIYIDVINSKMILNKLEKDISKEQIDNLLRIIRSWNNEYVDDRVIDAENFVIKINTIEGTEMIKGKGKIPDDYVLLKEWIGEFYE